MEALCSFPNLCGIPSWERVPVTWVPDIKLRVSLMPAVLRPACMCLHTHMHTHRHTLTLS